MTVSAMGVLQGTTIVFLNNFSGSALGGGEVHLLNLIEACVRDGMDVRVICEPGGALAERSRELGAAVLEHRFSGRGVLASARVVRRYCRGQGAAILHSTGWLTNIVGRMAVPRRVRAQAPTNPDAVSDKRPALVNTVHCEPDAPFWEGASRLSVRVRTTADRLTWRRADAVCPVSEAIASALADAGLDRRRIHVIPNGVDLEAVRRSAELPSVWPEGWPGDGPLVGTVARLEPVKGVDDFVRMAAIVADRRPDARFLAVGDGSRADHLHRLAESQNVSGRLAFIEGALSPMSHVARFDVSVLASRSEGAGIVLLEAMALGKPCVATRVGGIPEIVEDGVTGLLVPQGEPEALAEAVIELLDDPARAAAMGETGRKRVTEHFSLRGMTDAYLELYRELVTAQAGGLPLGRQDE